MALIICPECGCEVSNKAKVCPHCNLNFEEYEKNKMELQEGEEIKRKEEELLSKLEELFSTSGSATMDIVE